VGWQIGNIRVTCSIEEFTFYRRNGKLFIRMRSSLNKRRFWRHPKFEGSRRSCRRFGLGNQIASKVYKLKPRPERKYEVFCRLKSVAILSLKQGYSASEVEEMLIDYAQQCYIMPIQNRRQRRKGKSPIPYSTYIADDYVYFKIGHLMRWARQIGEMEVQRRVDSYFNDPVLHSPPQHNYERERA